ncbi:MAG: hypothetical protein ACOX6T_15645 [Myxococcales bacterium]|jgi:hypothetical protein
MTTRDDNRGADAKGLDTEATGGELIARRKLLKMVYVAPAIIGTLLISEDAAGQPVSCNPNANPCNPPLDCNPNGAPCNPNANPCSPPAGCNPNNCKPRNPPGAALRRR